MTATTLASAFTPASADVRLIASLFALLFSPIRRLIEVSRSYSEDNAEFDASRHAMTLPTSDALLSSAACLEASRLAYAATQSAWDYAVLDARTSEIAAETALAEATAARDAYLTRQADYAVRCECDAVRVACEAYDTAVLADQTQFALPQSGAEVCVMAANSPVVRHYVVLCDRCEGYDGWVAYTGHDEDVAVRTASYLDSRRLRFSDVSRVEMICDGSFRPV